MGLVPLIKETSELAHSFSAIRGHSSENATACRPEGSHQNPVVQATLLTGFQPSELQEVNSFCYKPHSLQYCQLQVGTCRGHLPSISTRIKSWAAAAADLQHLLKGVSGWRAAMRYYVLWGKLAEQVFRQLDIFRSQFYGPNSYISHIYKSTKMLHGD